MIRKFDKSLENNPGKVGCLTLFLSIFLTVYMTLYLVNFPIIYFLFPVILIILGHELFYKNKVGFGIFFYFLYLWTVMGISNKMDGPTLPSENPFISLEKYINLGYWEYNDFGDFSYYDFHNPDINFLYEISTGLIFLSHLIIFVIYFKYIRKTIK
jgi:hypothetical protein